MSRSANQATSLLFRHPHPLLLPSFCQRKDFLGNESERKKTSPQYTLPPISPVRKRLPISLYNLRTQIPQLSDGKLTNAPAHLTLNAVPKKFNRKGKKSYEQKTSQGCPQREKETNTCSSPPVFSYHDLHLEITGPLFTKFSLPLSSWSCLHLTRNYSLERLLYRCQNTASSSLEKLTLVVSLGELKTLELNSKTCAYSARLSTYSQARNRHAERAKLFNTHAREGRAVPRALLTPPASWPRSPASMFLVSSRSDTEVRSGRRAR